MSTEFVHRAWHRGMIGGHQSGNSRVGVLCAARIGSRAGETLPSSFHAEQVTCPRCRVKLALWEKAA